MGDLAAKILEKQNLACLHIPFSALAVSQGLSTQASMFVESLQQIDEHLIGPLRKLCAGTGDVRLFVVATSNGSTSPEGTHPPSPYVLYEGQKAEEQPSTMAFTEQEASRRPLHNATTFFERFFEKK
jgi:hypothetical protein